MQTEHSGKIESLKNAIVAALVEAAAAAAAKGALKGAAEVSSTALKTVRHAFIKTIHGVMVGPQEPAPALLSNN